MVITDTTTMLAAVNAAPFDVVTRLVLADAYEEGGDAAQGKAQRFIADLLKRGFHHDAPSSQIIKNLKYRFKYRKRTVRVELSVGLDLIGTHWDEGSRSEYHSFDLVSLAIAALSGGPYGSAVVPKFKLGNGVAVVETGWFCGKRSTMVIHVHPDDACLLGYEYSQTY